MDARGEVLSDVDVTKIIEHGPPDIHPVFASASHPSRTSQLSQVGLGFDTRLTNDVVCPSCPISTGTHSLRDVDNLAWSINWESAGCMPVPTNLVSRLCRIVSCQSRGSFQEGYPAWISRAEAHAYGGGRPCMCIPPLHPPLSTSWVSRVAHIHTSPLDILSARVFEFLR